MERPALERLHNEFRDLGYRELDLELKLKAIHKRRWEIREALDVEEERLHKQYFGTQTALDIPPLRQNLFEALGDRILKALDRHPR